jgi:peptidoglycan/xylan/chitin deacetylase (PgdA/CDA1 family)
MARHIVCLTFDFDSFSGFISRKQITPTPISRGEFGVVGTGRILELLAERGLKTTWFTPGFTVETYPGACERIVAAGHEIGHHGWTHVPPARLNLEEERADLERGIETIRRLTGARPRGYRSPSWDLSANTLDLLLANAFDYDSSMMGDDYTPYFARRGDVITQAEPAVFGSPSRVVELPISWSLDDYPHFEYVRTAEYVQQASLPTEAVLQNWIDDFTYMTRILDWGILTYTFHPFVIGRGHRMLMLERLIDSLAAGGAEFLTMAEAADAFLARVERPA